MQSQSFLEAGDDFCKLEYKNEDLSDLVIKLDRSKILTSGRQGKGAHLSIYLPRSDFR